MPAHDGSDYMHRQKILPHYQAMVTSKKQLKFSILMHYLIGIIMAFKLLPTILDLLNIFYQPIEELYIPMARHWEWVWMSGVLFTLFAHRAIKSNNIKSLKLYMLSILATCIGPIYVCFYLYANDLIMFIMSKSSEGIEELWRGYPVALYWFVFSIVALQVHAFELYISKQLLNTISNSRKPNKKTN